MQRVSGRAAPFSICPSRRGQAASSSASPARCRAAQPRIASTTGMKLWPLRVRRYSTFGGTVPKSLRSIRPLSASALSSRDKHARRDLCAASKAAQQTGSDGAGHPEVPHDPQLVLAADQFLKRGDRTAMAARLFPVRHTDLRRGRHLTPNRCERLKYHFCPYLHNHHYRA